MRTIIHLGTVKTTLLVVVGIVMDSDVFIDNPKSGEEKIFSLFSSGCD